MLLLLIACGEPPEPPPPPPPQYIWDLPFDPATSQHHEPVPWPGTQGEAPELPGRLLGGGDVVVVGGPDGLARWVGRPADGGWLRVEAVVGPQLPFRTVPREVLPALARGEEVRLPAELVLSSERVAVEVVVQPERVRLAGLPEGLSAVLFRQWMFRVWGASGAIDLMHHVHQGKLRLAPSQLLLTDAEQLEQGLSHGCFGPTTAERDLQVGAERWVARWANSAEPGLHPLVLVDPAGAEHPVVREMGMGPDRALVAGDITLSLVGMHADWAGMETWRPLFVEPSWILGCSFGRGEELETCELGEIRITHGDCEPLQALPVAGAEFVPERIVEAAVTRDDSGVRLTLPDAEPVALHGPWTQGVALGREVRLVLDAEGRAGWLAIPGKPLDVLSLGEAPPPPLPWLTDAQLEALVAGEAVEPAVDMVVRLDDAEVRVRAHPRDVVPLPEREAHLWLDLGATSRQVRARMRNDAGEVGLSGSVDVLGDRVVVVLEPSGNQIRP